MSLGKTKVAIVGCGSVGSTLAYQLVTNHICNDLLLIDKNKKWAWAQATDLNHSMGFSDARVNVKDGEYSECSDADIVVLTVGAPYRSGMTRLDMYDSACEIVRSFIPEIMQSGFGGIFLVVTNPVDLMTQYVQSISGLQPSRVIGTGTLLDSSRLRMYLAELMDVDPRSVNALCMGEHGDSLMIPWSQATVGGKPFMNILADNPQRLAHIKLDDVQKEISQIAYEVVENKGATYFGIASVTSQLIKAILFDENKVLPVSCMLENEYGFSGIYAGIPAVVNMNGVKESVSYHLTPGEIAELRKSLSVLQGYAQRR